MQTWNVREETANHMGIWLELSCTILLISLLPYMTCMQWTSEDKKIFIIFQFTQAHQTCNTFTHTALDEVFALCSRYFQNVKLRLHFVDRQFHRHSDFTGNKLWQIQSVKKRHFWQVWSF